MQELISVIVPVYNTAPYLNDCIHSVLAQTWPHFELLLIDDGSQDESAGVCRMFCEKDRRIRFLQQAHSGVSAARNLAMRAAKGDYLFFLDSDDAIHPRTLEALLQLAKAYGAAVAQADGQHVSSAELPGILQAADINQEYAGLYLENRQALEQIVRGDPITLFFHAIGGKLIRRDALSSFAFDEKMGNGEDTKLVYQLIASGADAVLLRRTWYYYRTHTQNASGRRSCAAYKDRYECKKYICEQERLNGRQKNAVLCEYTIIYVLLEWYRLSKEEGDGALTEYLKSQASAEIKSERFSLLPLYCRIQCALMLHWYPLYRCLSPLLLLRRKWMERRRKPQ